jgi:hypothetical protein
LNSHPLCTRVGIIEVIQVKPEDHTITNGKGWITKAAMLMLDLPLVQL